MTMAAAAAAAAATAVRLSGFTSTVARLPSTSETDRRMEEKTDGRKSRAGVSGFAVSCVVVLGKRGAVRTECVSE